ncbi:MAG: hypothetical protein RMJ51_02005 [Candidatus Calescibacterium sp.]|nr:hypothetical protein [Candidatus Calescibacterium sp.]MDW8195003.1 hypothetical protein [Candidatus Calescibacterium sp.]
MSGINPNDMVNRLINQGKQKVASTFGAMYQKNQEKQKIEKQSYDQYQILDKHSQAKEAEQNAKHSGLISQSLTNKELEEDQVLFDEQVLIEEGIKQQGLLHTYQDDPIEVEEGQTFTVSSTSDRIFDELAKKLGVSPKEIEKIARQEVENQLATNKNEMSQLKFPPETSLIEKEIYQEKQPASAEIKENKLIVIDNNPLDIEIAEKEF